MSTTTTNATTKTNIGLVHGAWADGSSWSKVIPTLKNAVPASDEDVFVELASEMSTEVLLKFKKIYPNCMIA
jgi:hypothetical protein